MGDRLSYRALSATTALLWSAHIFAACTVGKLAEIPVTMSGLRALVPVKLNGIDTQLVADSGAFYSMLSPGIAAQLKLRLAPSPMPVVGGLKGDAAVYLGTIDHFTLGDIALRGRWQFLVGGSDPGSDAAGLLGENILGIADTEYDLNAGFIRLLKPTGCGKLPLAYWAPGAADSMPIESTGRFIHIIGSALLNEHRIRVVFDTGSPVSLLSMSAAKRAGIGPDSPGVKSAGIGYGIGRATYRSWIGVFGNLQIGSEQIKNARLRFGEISLPDTDLLLGMDFFLSHRIYVALSQHKLYFTYNGGPVFNLTALRSSPAAPSSPAPAPAAAAASANPPSAPAVPDAPSLPPAQPQSGADRPPSAAELAARGRAFVSRHDFEHGIADLTQALQLDAGQPDYFYQRARAYAAERQPQPARADLDQALKLKPDYVEALFLRARLELAAREVTPAQADLTTLDHVLAAEADLRLEMSDLFFTSGLPAVAVHQADLWIEAHRSDARLANAFNRRCWYRTMWSQDLEQAERDCAAALKLAPHTPGYLDSLGWAQFRRGQFDRSVRTFDSALRLRPQLSSSLYGRGLSELRLGKKDAGDSDIAAAVAQDRTLSERLRTYGISP